MEITHFKIYPFLLANAPNNLTAEEQAVVNSTCEKYDSILKVVDAESNENSKSRVAAAAQAFCESPSAKTVSAIRVAAIEAAAAPSVAAELHALAARVGDIEGVRLVPIIVRLLESSLAATLAQAEAYRKSLLEQAAPLGLPSDTTELDGRIERSKSGTADRIARLQQNPGAAFDELEKLRIAQNPWHNYFA